MAGIACVERSGERDLVERMLDRLAHRGKAGRTSIEIGHASLGAVWPSIETQRGADLRNWNLARDSDGDGKYAVCEARSQGVGVAVDALGAAPLYWGHTRGGSFCCASEAKALVLATRDVHAFPPGGLYNGSSITVRNWQPATETDGPADRSATGLRQALATAVLRLLPTDDVGAWLTGRFVCTAVAAVAGRLLSRLHTFAIGAAGAPHLERAHFAAIFIGSVHHETTVTVKDLVQCLPNVIYSLESFDPALVRDSLLNYLLAQNASNCVPFALSGEGGDEVLGIGESFETVTPARHRDERIARVQALHSTVLKRMDRCAAAHGVVTRACFLTPKVLEVASRIPTRHIFCSASGAGILRQAMDGLLPEKMLEDYPEGLAWDAGGLSEELSAYVDDHVSEMDFARERRLSDGSSLRSKEELLYYRIFREHFGEFEDLSWTGREKAGVLPADDEPVQQRPSRPAPHAADP